MEDLAGYEAKQRAPLCGSYRSYRVCGMGMPSSGPATLLQVLGMVEQFNLHSYKVMQPEAVHILLEAMKLAYADRNRYWADSDYVGVPVHELLSRDYLASRGRLIKKEAVMEPRLHRGR